MRNEEGVFYVVEKCNDCVCNQVCKYKEVYQNGLGILSMFNTFKNYRFRYICRIFIRVWYIFKLSICKFKI